MSLTEKHNDRVAREHESFQRAKLQDLLGKKLMVHVK